MNTRDWRTSAPADIARLYRSEIARWDAVLHWDTRANWRLVEAARACGTLPGIVARDAGGAIQGWAFYLTHNGTLQVGALVSASEAATAAILDTILESPEADAASSVMLFTFPDAPALARALRRRGFAAGRYRYLQRSLADCAPGPCVGRGWASADQADVARLLSRAYAAPDASRPFVRDGRPEEWIEYVEQLVATTGCGAFLPEATVVIESSDRVEAIVLATRIGPGTAHLAQVAVDPLAQRSGHGRRIVSAALSNLRQAAYARATLLVAAANDAARGLYDQLGFVEAGTFISAVRDQPRRSTSVALETDGARTFR